MPATKTYHTPDLRCFGSVESVTAMIGSAGQHDYVFFASEQVPIDEYGGSCDVTVCTPQEVKK